MYRPGGFFWPNLERDNLVKELSVRELLKTYQGFEGDLKEIYYVKSRDPDLQSVYGLFLEVSKVCDCKILYIGSFSSNLPIPAVKMGYDVGICMEECIFSSIFHEMLFGRIPELVVFKNLLNEYFLFPDKERAHKYVQVHNKMEKEGRDVETHLTMEVHEIWRLG